MLHNTLFLYMFWQYPAVLQYQIHQSKLDHISILVVENAQGLTPMEVINIKEAIHNQTGPSMGIDICKVSNIPDSPSGKWRYVVSDLAT